MRDHVSAQRYREKSTNKVNTNLEDLKNKKTEDTVRAKEDLNREVKEFKTAFIKKSRMENAAKEKGSTSGVVGGKGGKRVSKAPVAKDSSKKERNWYSINFCD